MNILLDTSFLFALADASDRNHARVLDVARHVTAPLILPLPVLPEICYLLASRLGHAAMRRFLHELAASDTVLEPMDRASTSLLLALFVATQAARLPLVAQRPFIPQV